MSTTNGNVYKRVFKSAPIGFFRSMPQGRLIEVNDAFAQMLGYNSPDELVEMVGNIGNDLYFDPKFRTKILDELSRKEGLKVFETAFKKRNGQAIDVRIMVSSRYNESLQQEVLEGTIENISQRKQEQEALIKSKNYLSSLVSAMHDLVFIIDKDGKYEYIAPTRPELLISPDDDLTGRNLSDFFNPELVGKFLSSFNQCLQENTTHSIEYPLQLDGKDLWFEAKISPLTKTSVIIVTRDITDRVHTQKINQAMLNVAKAVSITEEMEELFDLIRQEISTFIDTRNFFLALFDSETNSLSLPYFRDENDSFDRFPAEKTLSSLVIEQKQSLLLRHKEIMRLVEEQKISVVGTIAKVWLGIPLMVEGEVLGVMVVQNYEHDQNITEEHKRVLETISPQISLSIKRKHYESLLKASEKELRISNETKDRFFNIIAHDLKNPFNAIIGFSSLLTEEWNEFDEDDKISMITSIRSSSESAYELLLNLLEWSRLRVGKISYEPEFIDYTSLIRLNLSLLKSAAEKKNIKLQNIGVCHKMVYADPNMIKTVILNLVTNAIKFTPINGTISIECEQRTDIPGMVVLAIKDNGVGIPESELVQLFSLSKPTSTAGTDGETGTGLGLVLCREFIEKNKGKIWAESHQNSMEQNPGTTFYIALPVRPM